MQQKIKDTTEEFSYKDLNIDKEISEGSEKQFYYLLEKIKKADFNYEPYKHISILSFFSEEHFEKIIKDKQILIEKMNDTGALISELENRGYVSVAFPGSITSVKDYIAYIDDEKNFNRDLITGYGNRVINSYGLTMRLKKYQSSFLKDLMGFLNSEIFKQTLLNKFDIAETTDIETDIQKNLNKYEISPHCDTKNKALTFLTNIYTDKECEKQEMHTRLMVLKDERKYLYDLWKYNEQIDTTWLPWDWCNQVGERNINNSLLIFKPAHDTLHAVKVEYNHLQYQRNQIYGNLYYTKKGNLVTRYNGDYTMVDVLGNFEKRNKNDFTSKVLRKLKIL